MLNRNITIYYITRAFAGLRFIIPIWATFFLRIVSFQQMAIGEIASMLIGILFELPSGVLADLIGRRFTVAIGFIIKAIGYALMATAKGFEQFLLGSCIRSLGDSFISGAEEALIYDTLKDNNALDRYSSIKAKEAIIYRIFLLLSIASGGYLYSIQKTLPYAFTALGTLLAGIFYFFAKEPHIDSKKFNVQTYFRQFALGAVESFKNVQTSTMSIYYVFLFALSFLLAGYFELLLVMKLGFTEKESGWIFTGLTFLTMMAAWLAPSIQRKMSKHFILFLIPTIPGIFMLLTFENKLYGLIVLGLENLILPYRFIFIQKYYNDLINSKYRASAISTLSMLINVVYVAVVFGISQLFALGDVVLVFQILGGLLLATGVLGIFCSKA